MALPGILLPAVLPPFLIAGHGAQWQSPFVDLPMTTGHRRKRRVCSVRRPQIVSVSLFLERDEMTAFHLWFRDTLRSGERSFAARVKEQGVGMLWYSAAWVDMYQATAMHLGRWHVDGQLLLSGDGQADEPTLQGLSSNVVIALNGSAALTVDKPLSSSVVIALLDAAPAVIES